MISYDFSGKRFAVIGVSKGLGFAIAYKLNEAKGEVVINARSKSKLEEIRGSMPNMNLVKVVEGDATEEGVLRRIKELGPYDGVVITIGGYVEDTVENPKGLDEMLENHVKAPVRVLSGLVNSIREGGSVVLVSALRGIFNALPTQLSYAVAKAGVAKLVEVLASELLERGIRVNGIAPSVISGEFSPNRDYRKLRKLGDPSAPPEDFANVVLWLLSEGSEWVNGVVIPVDGGFRLKLR